MSLASIMVRRSYLAASRGLNADFRHAIDFELFFRLVWEQKIRYANLPETLYLYRQRGSSVRRQSGTGALAGFDTRKADRP